MVERTCHQFLARSGLPQDQDRTGTGGNRGKNFEYPLHQGASADRTKYGNKDVRPYSQGEWTFCPVHPVAEDVEWLKCCDSYSDVPSPIDHIFMYAPPNIERKMLIKIAAKNAA